MWELLAMSAWILVFFIDVYARYEIQFGSVAAFTTFAVFVSAGIGSWFGGFLAGRWGRTTLAVLLIHFR
jgi:hypothetical protein